MSWASRRKAIYAIGAAVLVLGASGLIVFEVLYKSPTCFDGIQNGGEQGVDCGGSCVKLCQSAFMQPDVAWTRFEEVSPGLYNLAAYVINPNIDAEAVKVPFKMTVFDNQGMSIMDQSGKMTLAPHRNSLAFLPAISVGKRTPSKVLFEFASYPEWIKKADPLTAISISKKQYSEDESGSSLDVTLDNKSLYSMPRLAVYVVLYDAAGNAIGFSRTYVDGIAPESSVSAPFTWPISRNGKVVSIEVLPVAE